MVRVARARRGDVQHVFVEPRCALLPDAPGVRGIAQLDAVDTTLRRRVDEGAQRALADREGEIGQRVGHDRDPAHLVDLRDRRGERAEHRHLVLDPQREEVTGARRDFDPRDDLDRAVSARGEIAEDERPADVVVIGERDDVHPRTLRGVEDRLRRREPVAQVGVQLEIRLSGQRSAQTRSNTVH